MRTDEMCFGTRFCFAASHLPRNNSPQKKLKFSEERSNGMKQSHVRMTAPDDLSVTGLIVSLPGPQLRPSEPADLAYMRSDMHPQ
jgi:hypothetical protein